MSIVIADTSAFYCDSSNHLSCTIDVVEASEAIVVVIGKLTKVCWQHIRDLRPNIIKWNLENQLLTSAQAAATEF